MTPNLTAGGKNLLLRALTGETINFTKIQLGNGLPQAAQDAISLSNPLLTVPLSSITIGDEYVTLTAAFSNGAVTSGFHITEAGFFAEDPDDPTKEILYAIGNEDESAADYIPDKGNRILEMQFDALIFVGDAENVTAAINSSLVYASKTEFDEHTENKQNPHNVTKAQVGLDKVPNVATNDQTPTYADTTTLATLTSGEKISIAFGKIKLAITSLINHLSNKENPHGVTASQVKAAAQSHTHAATDINSGTLSVLRGGTGLSSPTTGGLLKANGSSACTSLQGIGALYSTTTGNPVFGTLPVSMGGTGVTSMASLAANLINNGLTRIVTGSYAGNGSYGASNPKSLTFTSPPQLILVMPAYSTNPQNGGFIALHGVTSLRSGGLNDDVTTNTSSQLYLTWSGNTVSWYGTAAAQQNNTSGTTYYYLALL